MMRRPVPVMRSASMNSSSPPEAVHASPVTTPTSGALSAGVATYPHETIRDVYVDRTFGGQMAHGIVAMKPLFPGHAKQIGRLVADMTSLKRITVVDATYPAHDEVTIRLGEDVLAWVKLKAGCTTTGRAMPPA